ncbi:IclR family transcriptional regulator [Actinomadura xylanilytica]|uniref:IclR family transcriptional regulator n=1 Tax=Actinomadura xylanilytica TaxID=887459 RepID=UPI00255ACD12|nr:IclR family transcriptional regulator [Actinomadura xylanilytica]MDL4772532.1 IclR family transcriptional regulator [Actinomadura xylanilytica]
MPQDTRSAAGRLGQSATTVERAADVLVLFTAPGARTLGVTEIADVLGLSKPAVHRILTSLRSRGLVEVDAETRRYALGLTAMRLGLAYLDAIDVRRLAAPDLVALSRATRETATLSSRVGAQRVYIDQVTPDREVLMSVTLGVPFPLHAGASSKAFLAFLPDAEVEEYLSVDHFSRLTDRTVVDPEALRPELEEIRRDGYARSFAERQSGAASVAAPVFDHHGRPAAVVSVCGPVERFRGEAGACAAALLEVTARLSTLMGHVTDRG